VTAVPGDPGRHPRLRKPANDAMDRACITRLGAGPDSDAGDGNRGEDVRGGDGAVGVAGGADLYAQPGRLADSGE
jgi:hypothetical protein